MNKPAFHFRSYRKLIKILFVTAVAFGAWMNAMAQTLTPAPTATAYVSSSGSTPACHNFSNPFSNCACRRYYPLCNSNVANDCSCYSGISSSDLSACESKCTQNVHTCDPHYYGKCKLSGKCYGQCQVTGGQWGTWNVGTNSCAYDSDSGRCKCDAPQMSNVLTCLVNPNCQSSSSTTTSMTLSDVEPPALSAEVADCIVQATPIATTSTATVY